MMVASFEGRQNRQNPDVVKMNFQISGFLAKRRAYVLQSLEGKDIKCAFVNSEIKFPDIGIFKVVSSF
jgi:hypothetical protein